MLLPGMKEEGGSKVKGQRPSRLRNGYDESQLQSVCEVWEVWEA